MDRPEFWYPGSAEAPTMWGYDQARNQSERLFWQWVMENTLSPYLPERLPQIVPRRTTEYTDEYGDRLIF